MAAYTPRGTLEMMEARKAPKTANGQRRIARPAKGTQAVSRKGPSLPTRSSISLFHPLKSITGNLYKAITVNIIPSVKSPHAAANTAPGMSSTLEDAGLIMFDFVIQNSLRKTRTT